MLFKEFRGFIITAGFIHLTPLVPEAVDAYVLPEEKQSGHRKERPPPLHCLSFLAKTATKVYREVFLPVFAPRVVLTLCMLPTYHLRLSSEHKKTRTQSSLSHYAKTIHRTRRPSHPHTRPPLRISTAQLSPPPSPKRMIASRLNSHLSAPYTAPRDGSEIEKEGGITTSDE